MRTLYGYWRSSAAYRVRIALNYKQLTVRHIPVHLVKDGGEQHQQDYIKLNPQHLVPSFQDDDFQNGKLVLTQSMAIIEYLDEKYLTNQLLPKNIENRAIIRSMAQSIACDLHPLNNLRVLKYLASELGITEDGRDNWYQHWITLGFDAFETMLATHSGQYCFKDEFSLADICLIPQVYNAQRFNIPMENYHNINRVMDNCLQLDCVLQAQPESQNDAI